MTIDEIRQRLLELARLRLRLRFGAFENFRLTLAGLSDSAGILAAAACMPTPWTKGLKMGLGSAANLIDTHFLKLIDAWAQDEAPALQIVALEGLQSLPHDLNIEASQHKTTGPCLVSAQHTATLAPLAEFDSKALQNKVRELAHEIIRRQRVKDLYPSQEDLGDEIAKDLRIKGVMGADGKPLCGASIKRHYLKGISSAVVKQLSTQTGRGKQGS